MTNDLKSHQSYVAWIRLTHNGKRSLEDMTPLEQTEFKQFGLRSLAPIPDPMTDEQLRQAKVLYEAACAEMDTCGR